MLYGILPYISREGLGKRNETSQLKTVERHRRVDVPRSSRTLASDVGDEKIQIDIVVVVVVEPLRSEADRAQGWVGELESQNL